MAAYTKYMAMSLLVQKSSYGKTDVSQTYPTSHGAEWYQKYSEKL